MRLCSAFALLMFLSHGVWASDHPVPESPLWITFPGGDGPGKGKHVVFIAADQEYRSEQALPMLAKVFAKHHGFHCTVLFSVNDQGEVDPTKKIRWPKEPNRHRFVRLLTR